ncbi:MAG: hypothetical protein PHS93_07735 [Candidatus Omnitrophica bacterium]|nr:hypothetical protein [Candidatus Omnitrophota bacterium]
MKTLATNVSSYYKKQGKQPRFFIRIADADLFLATKTLTDSVTDEGYTDKVQKLGTITEEIDWLGGMSTVSGLDMENIELGERVTLCTEITKTPKWVDIGGGSIIQGCGRCISTNPLYATSRNSTTGAYATPGIVIGRTYNAGTGIYGVYRGVLYFDIPAGITTCEEAVIELIGAGDYSDTNFNLVAVQGTFTTLDSSTFNDFTGWAGSGAYSPTILSDVWPSSEYTSGTTVNKIRINTAGLSEIVAQTGSTLKVILISYNDYHNEAAPSGDEYVQFEATSAVLKLRYNTKTLDNKEAEIYLDYETISTTYTDMQLLRKYVIDDYSITDSSLSLKLKDNNFKHNPMVPDTIFDLVSYPYLVNENIGKAIPVIYGNFQSSGIHKEGVAYVSDETTPANIYSLRDYVKAYIYDDRSGIKAQLAGHDIKAIEFLSVIYESSIEGYVILVGTLGAVAGSGNNKIELSSSVTTKFPNYLLETEDIQPVCMYIPKDGENFGADNWINAIDEDPDNYTSVGAGDTTEYWFNMRPYGVTNIFNTRRYVCFYTYAPEGYDNNLICHIYTYNTDATWDKGITINSDGWHYIDLYGYIDNRNALAYSIDFSNITGTKITRISNICLCAGYQKSIETEIYVSVQGRPDDGSGTITGVASQLLEIPSHVIESVARDEMSLATANINTTSFDTSAISLASWLYAFQWLNRKNVQDYLHDLGRQCKSRVFWDSDDKLKIVTFSSSTAFPVSGTNIPSGLDIFDTTGNPTSGSFTTNPILPDSLSIDRTSMDQVYNDFALKYKQNYATGEYEGVLYMTNGAGTVGSCTTNMTEAYLESSQTLTALKTLCAASYTKYGSTTRTLEFEASCIRTEATANKLLQYLIERTTDRHYTVTLTTNFTAIAHELGDFINVQDPRLNDLFGTATAERKKWEIIKIEQNLDECTISITAIEVD